LSLWGIAPYLNNGFVCCGLRRKPPDILYLCYISQFLQLPRLFGSDLSAMEQSLLIESFEFFKALIFSMSLSLEDDKRSAAIQHNWNVYNTASFLRESHNTLSSISFFTHPSI